MRTLRLSSEAVARGLPGVSPASFSLTTLACRDVAAIMKLDGIRGFADYDIAEGIEWTQQLAREFKQAARSVDIVKGSRSHLSLSVFAILLGCCWVLKEMKMVWVIWDNVQVDFEN